MRGFAKLVVLLLGAFVADVAVAQINAQFISQSVPTSMVAGQTYSVSVTMQNTGGATWTEAQYFRLGSQNGQDNLTWGLNRAYMNSAASVAPGQNCTFTFNVTAPATSGTYNFQWQMVQDGVAWFGAQTPNVGVNVGPAAPRDAQFVSQSVPSSMIAGQTYSVSVTMQNTGATTWTAAQNFRLGSQNPRDNGTWGFGRVYIDSSASVATGQNYTFTFVVTAPTTSGTYNFQWQMLQENVAWFGVQTPNIAISVGQAPVGSTTIMGLGQNYEAYDFGTYTDNLPFVNDYSCYNGNCSFGQNNNNWYNPAHQFKNPVSLYHLNPSLVQTQMQNMRASGIDVLVLHMNLGDLNACEQTGACATQFNDGVWGDVIDDSWYGPRPQQNQNLHAIIQYAAHVGFRKLILRFDHSHLGDLTSIDQGDAYSKAWNFVYNAHNIATGILNSTATRLIVDLGGEETNNDCNNCVAKQFLQKLWSDYNTAFGNSDTVGFSTTADPTAINTAQNWYGYIKPAQYAFDVESSVPNTRPRQSTAGDAIVNAWSTLPQSEQSKPIMIMETWTNDPTTGQNIAQAVAGHPGMNLTDVIQWPITVEGPPVGCTGCDQNIQNSPIAALATTTQVSNYRNIANKVAIDNTNPSLISISDVNCSTSGSPCTLQGTFNGNSTWVVYIQINDQAPNMTGNNWWSCGGANGSAGAPWIDKSNTYRFNYYRVSSCSQVPTAPPDASSFVSFR